MAKKLILVGILATTIRFLIFGGLADVLALAIFVTAYFLDIYISNKPKEETDTKKLQEELEALKSQVSALNLAQGIKKLSN
ncbi:hypothetical protein ACES2J_08305 [Bdellovibrio bacteriovorus]|uniref:hypothetical protein n=1 Tax=Bdellovibrio bacteriovorus TaxID=959 RepID=UPI0035A59731